MNKKNLIKILVVFGSVVISLSAAEIFLKILSTDYINSGIKTIDDNSDRFRFNPELGYEFNPESPGINSFGMRDREYNLQKKDGIRRIAVLGDSLTDNNIWTEHLEKKLGGKFEVLNFAVMGYNLYQYGKLYKEKVEKFDPDILILALCLDDIPDWSYAMTVYKDKKIKKLNFVSITSDYDVNESGLPRPKNLDINAKMFYHSALYRYFYLKILSLKYAQNYSDFDYEPVKKLLSGFKADNKTKVYAIIFPFIKTKAEYHQSELQKYEITKTALKQCGISYIDLHDTLLFKGKEVTDFRIAKNDERHFNDELGRFFADTVLSDNTFNEYLNP